MLCFVCFFTMRLKKSGQIFLMEHFPFYRCFEVSRFCFSISRLQSIVFDIYSTDSLRNYPTDCCQVLYILYFLLLERKLRKYCNRVHQATCYFQRFRTNIGLSVCLPSAISVALRCLSTSVLIVIRQIIFETTGSTVVKLCMHIRCPVKHQQKFV